MKRLPHLNYRTSILLLTFAINFILNFPVARAADPNPKDLIQRLEQPQTRDQAIRDLSAMGDSAIPDMIAGLDSPTKEVRSVLANRLGDIKAGKAIPSLLKMTQSKEYFDSCSGLNALGKIGGAEAAEAIIAALPKLHPTGQEDYCRVLAAIGDNRAIEPLIKLLTSRDSEDAKKNGDIIFKIRAREASAEALGTFREPRTREALRTAIKDDPDWEVYRAARKALCRMDVNSFSCEYEKLSNLVAMAVNKQPMLSDTEEYMKKWLEENKNGERRQWAGARLENFASKVDIELARYAVVENGKTWGEFYAGGVIELLMEHLYSRGKINLEDERNAKPLLIQIGKPAIPALENGVKRGNTTLAKNCQQCIEAIKAAEQSTMKATNSVSPVVMEAPEASVQQAELLALFKQKYPDYFKNIAIHGYNPSGTMLLFLVKNGGTYLFRKDSGEVESIPSLLALCNIYADNINILA